MIASVSAAMTGTNSSKTAGSGVGLPSGLRACRCRIAAPARAASIACSAICKGVTGRYSDMDGVWTDPVTAQVMMTLRRPDVSLTCPSTMSKIFDIAVHADRLTGDVAGQVGGKEQGEVGHVLRLHHPAQRDLAEVGVAHGLEADALRPRPVGDD